MTVLIIIVSIVAILLLIMLIPLRLKIEYIDDFKLHLYYGFLKFDLLKEKKPEKTKKVKKTAAVKQSAETKEKDGMFKKLRKKYGLIGAISHIKEVYVLPVFNELSKLSRKFTINPLYLNLQLASSDGDAAKLSTDYGKLCAIFYPILAIVENQIKLKKQKINIGVNYLTSDIDFRFHLIIRTRPLHLTVSGVRAIFKIIIKSSGYDNSLLNERNVHRYERKH